MDLIKYSYNNEPLCPYCDETHDNYEADCYEGGEQVEIVECPHCGEEYEIQPNIDITFCTNKKEG